MVVQVSWAGRQLALSTTVFDVNGTLTRQGALIAGVAERLARLRGEMDVLLVSADTYGTVPAIALELGVTARIVGGGADKAAILTELGADSCAAVGNGNNDGQLLRAAALGIAVLGPEGLAPGLLGAADLICASTCDAIDLLLEPRGIVASLRP